MRETPIERVDSETLGVAIWVSGDELAELGVEPSADSVSVRVEDGELVVE